MKYLLLILISCPAWAMQYDVTQATRVSGEKLNVVRMSGIIDSGEWMNFMAATSSLDANSDTLFVLNSPGGSIPMGLFLIKKVDEYMAAQAQNHHQTWILVEKDCSSMCVPLFYAWANRYAVPDARIGLHAASDGFFGTDGDLTHFYLDDMVKRAKSRNDSGMLDWLNKKIAEGDFTSSKLTPYTAEQVANDNGLLKPGSMVNSERDLINKL